MNASVFQKKPQASWRNGRPYSLSWYFTHSSEAGMMFAGVGADLGQQVVHRQDDARRAAKPGIGRLLQAMTMSGGAPPATGRGDLLGVDASR